MRMISFLSDATSPSFVIFIVHLFICISIYLYFFLIFLIFLFRLLTLVKRIMKTINPITWNIEFSSYMIKKKSQ